MGVTAIKSVANTVAGALYIVRNLETPSDTGGEGKYLEVWSGQNRRVNMWVPWSDNQTDFGNGKRITFEALIDSQDDPSNLPDSYNLWQSGDYLYFSRVDRFDSGEIVHGNSTINGDRSLEITTTGIRCY
ncbi:hypothetical protein E0H75_07115 [Kribbella capetownensis]|uniref:Uncharacterized protein n=1 Tax=Kribbella capetownensis TaxID=1572659 RepID=A0A4R0K0K8_9ACTN|nr:hypothetical protein [Kribbella capetownensis]TCC53453.1 hypothetical protein E0H75_07115 [Kribbella capetownensis]